MIKPVIQKMWPSKDGYKHETLANAQSADIQMLLAGTNTRNAIPVEIATYTDKLMEYSAQVVEILRNRPARGKDRKPRQRKKSLHDQASEILDRAAAEGIARENAKQAKKVAGITFGKGGVTKDQE